MKTKRAILLMTILMFPGIGMVRAQDTTTVFLSPPSEGSTPHIGISLDTQPLDDLLVKHLQLGEDQGIRITNVVAGSPADKAGIVRDDIVIAFEGKDVSDVQEFISEVKQAGLDNEVSLGIIHLGQRKEIKMKLTARPDAIEWKHPPEPQAEISWQPGKIFHLQPGADEWIEIPGIPETNMDVRRFLTQIYKFKHSENGSNYDITIHGDPENPQTKIELNVEKSGTSGLETKTEISATVGDIDKIPDEYKPAVMDALKNARKTAKSRQTFTLPAPKVPRYPLGKDNDIFKIDPPSMDIYKQYFDNGFRDDIHEQMKKLQEQMERLNKEHKEMMDKMLEKFKKNEQHHDETEEKPAGKPEKTSIVG